MNVRCIHSLRRKVVQSPIWISDVGGGGILPPALCRIPIPPSRNQKTFCTRPPPIQSKWFAFGSASAVRPGFQTLGGWRRGNLVSIDRSGAPPVSIQSSGFARPLSGSRRHPVYPNISFSSKSSPFMICHIALASLQASAFLALGTPLLAFLRSYQAWMRGLKRAAKVAASTNAHAR